MIKRIIGGCRKKFLFDVLCNEESTKIIINDLKFKSNQSLYCKYVYKGVIIGDLKEEIFNNRLSYNINFTFAELITTLIQFGGL